MATRAQGKKIKKVVKKDAKIHLQQAIKIDPDFLDARYELGSLLLSEGELKGAEEQFNKVVKLDNNHAEGYYKLALISAENRKNKKARDLFEKAVTIKFDDTKIQFDYGLFLKKLKKYLKNQQKSRMRKK